jgi:hypothetical protein
MPISFLRDLDDLSAPHWLPALIDALEPAWAWALSDAINGKVAITDIVTCIISRC